MAAMVHFSRSRFSGWHWHLASAVAFYLVFIHKQLQDTKASNDEGTENTEILFFPLCVLRASVVILPSMRNL